MTGSNDNDNEARVSALRERIAAIESAQLRDDTPDRLVQLETVQERHDEHIVVLIERTDTIEEKILLLAREVQNQAQRMELLERETAESRATAARVVELLEVSLELTSETRDMRPVFRELFDRVRSVASSTTSQVKLTEIQEALQKISISLNRLTTPDGLQELPGEVRQEFEADYARFQRARLGVEFMVPAATYAILGEMASLAHKAYRLRVSGGPNGWSEADTLCDKFLTLRPTAADALRTIGKTLHSGTAVSPN